MYTHGEPSSPQPTAHAAFEPADARLMEQFPRQMLFEFADLHPSSGPPASQFYIHEAEPHAFPSGLVPYHSRPQGYSLGQPLGLPQTDQSYENDGFRFRYAFSIANMAITGWSAVMRNLLSLRRRSLPNVERIEDGSRAMHAEEYLFSWFGRMAMGRESSAPSEDVVRRAAAVIRTEMTPFMPTEQEVSATEWERVLTTGYALWSLIKNSIGLDTTSSSTGNGKSVFVYVDLDSQEVRFSAESGDQAKTADPL